MTGADLPTYEAGIPDMTASDGEMAAALAAECFGTPMAWQRRLLDVMLARDASDLYVAKSVAVSMPRQNGKSWVVRARCLYGIVCGERILYTCQHGDTSGQMFEEMARVFEDEQCELHGMLEAVRRTNGQQGIRLKPPGGMIRFTTRTDSLARGRTYDVLIYDEAQDLTPGQQAASLPAISAGPCHNPQTIYLGTPCTPGGTGTVFRGLRDAVRAGKPGTAWLEWGVDSVGDVADRARWARVNPSLGRLVDVSAVEAECAQMASDVFARERLGWWSPACGMADPALDPAAWDACCRPAAMEGGKFAFGVKFSPDGRAAAVSWARAERGGPSYVELYDVAGTGGGTVGISDMLLRHRDEVAAVCVDGKAGADALARRLLDGGYTRRAVTLCTASIAQAAASMLRDEVDVGTVTHIASPALDVSAKGSVRRSIGRDGGWGFGDGPDSQAVAVESAALALWAARTTKRDPGLLQEANF